MRTKAKAGWMLGLDLLFLLLVILQVQISNANSVDTILSGQTLPGNGTLTSKGGVFEMGLFSPPNSTNYYLGIWYKGLPMPHKTVVWVANRLKPISDPTSTSLEFGEDGNLVLLSPSGHAIWSTSLNSVKSNATVLGVLGDDGNFILRDTSNSSNVLWQSFDHPTDTWLPGAQLRIQDPSGQLSSWTDTNDPTPGIFSALYVFGVKVRVQPRNRSEDLGIVYPLDATTYIYVDVDYDQLLVSRHAVFSVAQEYESGLFRCVLDVDGRLKLFGWWKGISQWNSIPLIPLHYSYSPCPCGDFTVCDLKNAPLCHCIKGFVHDQNLETDTCTRRIDLNCTNRRANKFFVMPNIRYPPRPSYLQVNNASECRLACLQACPCSAYAYYDSQCLIWEGSLQNIQELSSVEEIGGDFYVRVAASEIEETRRNKRATWVVVVAVLIPLAAFLTILKIMWRKLHGCSLEALGDTLMHFKHPHLQKATKNFTQKLGEGGFSHVYMGQFPNSVLVAVKQLKGHVHGDKQFQAEISTIGVIQHKNLLRLRGFCSGHSGRFLVYDYMPNGSLQSHLFNKNASSNTLDWATRYHIALGTAKGLAYLHESCRDCIIHCDIKPENILLDADFTPRVADFGLAKLLGRNFSKVLTTMRGTRGYLAPEWFSCEAITAKVDVYSYGQVLFEIISGRRNMDLSNDELSNYFPSLVLNALNNGEEVVTLIDPKLEGDFNVEELTRACKVACWCIQDHENDRPTMPQVVQILEGLVHVGVPPIPQFFRSLAGGSLRTYDVKDSEICSTSSSIPYSLSFQPPCKAEEAGILVLDVLLLIILQVQISNANSVDTILPGQTVPGNGTLTSKGGVFEMGLFSPPNSTNYYLGIWYKGLPMPHKTVVWVANREHPISDPTSTSLEFGEDGNLVLLSPSKHTIWSTSLSFVTSLPNATVLGVLGDDGNFIVRDTSNSSNTWQSFDHPTDTWLPGARFGAGFNNPSVKLTSWKHTNDPTPGIFYAFYLYWIGVTVQPMNSSEDLGIVYELINATSYTKVDFSYLSVSGYLVFSVRQEYESGLFRYVLDVNGHLKLFGWWNGIQQWNLIPLLPQKYSYSKCSCATFGICDVKCDCIKGFERKSQKDWDLRIYVCTRRIDLDCTNSTTDKFIVMPNTRYPLGPSYNNSGECRLACLATCSCSAYAYYDSQCLIWEGPFQPVQQLSSVAEIGGDFYVRVAKSEMDENGSKRATLIIVVVVLVSIAAFSIILKILWRKLHASSLVALGDTLMYFKHQQLHKATKNFTQKLGEGGFSHVYLGEFPNSALVAVKQFKGHTHGDKQLRAEISTIGIIQHKNLLRLRGFCLGHSGRFLVYDYMPNGSLQSHLFNKNSSSSTLDWETRYNIALGTAKGLAYLHESCRDCIIHCDIKPENILLDADFTPKVADFGLAKLLGRNFSKVLTTMRGTRGYLAPEWFSCEAITAKVDVYSYGQVLFEIISGRRNMDLSNDELSNYFPSLVLNALNNGEEVVTLIDPKLEGDFNVEELTRACKVACWCIQDHENDRPTMPQVVQILEGLVHVGVPPIPQFFRSLAGGSLRTYDVKDSEICSTSSSIPYSLSFQPPCKAEEAGILVLDVLLLIILQVQISNANSVDTILPGQTVPGNGTLTSKGGVFEMGLFSPPNSTNYYLGIWYKGLPMPHKTVVWVANREHPISDPTSTSLEFGEDGNLVLLSPSKHTIWSTSLSFVTSLPNATVLGVLGDDGNFIVRDTSNSSNTWQSFDHPTDTWLPGARFGAGFNNPSVKLTSWKHTNDPTPGIFYAFYLYWIGVTVQPMNSSEDLGIVYELINATSYTKVDFSYLSVSGYLVFSVRQEYESGLFRYVLDVNGHLKLFGWWNGIQQWNLIPLLPQKYSYSKCSCATFGICDVKCDCIKGFERKSQKDWDLRIYVCTRRIDLDCTNSTTDKFIVMPNTRYPLGPSYNNSGECRLACLATCSCSAYAYYDSQCLIWEGPFQPVQQLSSVAEIGGDFYVRVAKSEMDENGSKRATLIIVVVVLVSIAAFSIILKILWRKLHASSLVALGDTLMYFKHQQLHKATKNFTQKLGEGGFSHVYLGEFPNSALVAVKQFKGHTHGDKQLRAEISTIGIIQHKNLLRLRGFCLGHSGRFLVYDYMPNGSLQSHLFNKNSSSSTLDWETRYNIALGTAKGLAYLHESCRDCIIHCDIKPENILLDADFTPKVADFGLAKLLGRNFSKVLTTMRGTRGYLAPEWFSCEAITAKVDVYSYGQVLFEIISGRRNMDLSNDELSNYFPSLVLNALNNGEEVVTLIDPKLEGDFNVEELTRACKVACWCIQDHENDRPTMPQVVQILEGLVHVGVPPIPQFFRSLAGGSLRTYDVKDSEICSTSSSIPYSLSFQPPVIL
ncbi:G-type lectin S-receptor-like serine/threonine-protein kinase [Senna tora]|uniref:non-specific serine/threonine protein kinase n=1 Tax=Senna tora TaxID=362788 RepID=A0A834SL86_9FABA|nr:G-type lectin S-receptor-like serine/threonine-protein kinase [Senna tora]